MFDASGNGNNIQLGQGSPADPTAATAHFDGVDDSIGLANPAGLPTGGADFTWSAWVKTAPSAANQAVITLGNVAGGGVAGQLLILPNGQLAFDSSGITYVSGGPVLTDGEWHHVAATTASGLTELFVDGVSVTAPTNLSLNMAGGNAFIGMSVDGFSFPFNGEIADVRVYDAARSVGDIAADKDVRLTGGEPNLVAYYPLDGESGGVVADLAGGDNDGALLGAKVDSGPIVVATTPADTPALIVDVYEDLTVTEDTPLTARLAAKDAEGDSLTFTLDADAGNGTIALSPDGTFTYTPDAEFSGYDSFTVTVDRRAARERHAGDTGCPCQRARGAVRRHQRFRAGRHPG